MVARPFARSLVGLGVMGAVSLGALHHFGVSLSDLRSGKAVGILSERLLGGVSSQVLAGAGGCDVSGGGLAGMLDGADLGSPGGVRSLLESSGTLGGDGAAGLVEGGEAGAGGDGRARGVVIFSPDAPVPAAPRDPSKPAPIIRPSAPPAE